MWQSMLLWWAATNKSIYGTQWNWGVVSKQMTHEWSIKPCLYHNSETFTHFLLNASVAGPKSDLSTKGGFDGADVHTASSTDGGNHTWLCIDRKLPQSWPGCCIARSDLLINSFTEQYANPMQNSKRIVCVTLAILYVFPKESSV